MPRKIVKQRTFADGSVYTLYDDQSITKKGGSFKGRPHPEWDVLPGHAIYDHLLRHTEPRHSFNPGDEAYYEDLAGDFCTIVKEVHKDKPDGPYYLLRFYDGMEFDTFESGCHDSLRPAAEARAAGKKNWYSDEDYQSIRELKTTGVTKRGDVHVKIVPYDGGYGVETTVKGDRRYPTEEPVTIERAVGVAMEQLVNPRPSQM